MKIKLLSVLMFQLVVFCAHAQFIAGNHGEGVILGDKVVLRDLYRYNQTEDLYFGKAVNPGISQRVSDFDRIALTAHQKELLSRKFTDIDSLSPCLGKVLASMMYMYAWQWTNEEFQLNIDVQEVGRIPDEMRKVVAKRFYSEILLQKNYWDKMPDEHKVALIVHEMLYALQTPNHLPNIPGAAFQDVNIVRAMVSNLFAKPSVYIKPQFKNQKRYLAIPEELKCDMPEYISTRFANQLGESVVPAFSDSGLEKSMGAQCLKAAKSGNSLQLTVPTSSFSIQARRYKAFDGQQNTEASFGIQTWNKVCTAPVQVKTTTVLFEDVSSCIEQSKSWIYAAIDAKDYNPPVKGCNPDPWK